MDEEALVRRAITGDEEAFLHLIKQYEQTMYRMAFAYLKNEHDAIEAVQEATYRSLKKIHTVKEPGYFGTWLVRILLNICHDMRKRSSRLDLQEDIEIGDHAPNHERFEITDIITKLPNEQQELIFLKYFQDYKNRDIAILQNIPEGTVKSRLHAALKKLKLYFTEKGEL
ncbi:MULTISPECIES: sigma-70 family RNA polymerase sigma factor [unclassified Lysinibacillus]|uniref:sigma-70 family RNA polymerase sigma factor n=1 Tax=unclassified Lysinibacillus TaxID=2636778 RepID=UPI002011EAD7|nr:MULTISPECIES: sigma-70 family RNA polymerase sigma factor [unclassified Lysinibacillus]MCL1696221.1 sigma-70 family RNA polymerase sigma factor [Lysinibacillus sp. BPa_S21]MCL1700404.1 sigma-70 family RNA polymerase sigma factor [Lysinibacillus sp. Bpr_S20]